MGTGRNDQRCGSWRTRPARLLATLHLGVLILATLAAPGCSTLMGGREPSEDELLLRAADAAEESRQQLAKATRSLAEKDEAVSRAEAELAKAKTERDQSKQVVREARRRLLENQRAVSESATDTALFRLVQRRLLEDKKLKDVAISVYVVDGVITLQGSVPDEGTRDHALTIVRNVPGVTFVDSQMGTRGGGRD